MALVAVVLAAHLWNSRTAATLPPPSPTAGAAAPPRLITTAPATSTAPTMPTEPSATPSSAVSTGPYGGTPQARRRWEPVVQGFAIAYTDTAGRTHKQWLTNLRPYLDQDVVDALADTDLAKVPVGHYAGYQVLKLGDEAITVRVSYQEGWALVLYLAADGHQHWLIVQFDLATADDA